VIRGIGQPFHTGQLLLPFRIRFPFSPSQIIIESSTTYAQQPAKQLRQVGLPLLGNELISQSDSFAKKAAAFLEFRAPASVADSRHAAVAIPPARASACHCPERPASHRPDIPGPSAPSMLALMPKFRAASARLYPCSVTKRIASSLNSFVYRFLFVISQLSFRDYPLTEVSVGIRPRQQQVDQSRRTPD